MNKNSDTFKFHHLVSDETIALQKALTQTFTLDNGLKVTYRNVPDADILEFSYMFKWGRSFQKNTVQIHPTLLFSTMHKSAEGWSKEQIFTTTERYSTRVSCSAGIEFSECSLSTINDYWREVLPMMAAIIQKPLLEEEDIQLAIDAEAAHTLQYIQDPEDYVNDIVNTVFYPDGHPYKMSAHDILEQLKSITRKDLKELHQTIINESEQQITVVGSLPIAELKKDLNQFFGTLNQTSSPTHFIVPKIPFVKENSFKIFDKKIPTAYISIKFNLPGVIESSEPETRLLFAILNDELWEEVRTKNSLSYAVHAQSILHQLGIGIIHVSTSLPQETFAAIIRVLSKIKNTPYTDRQLSDHKTRFVTKYFLTLESHDSLSSALTRSVVYSGSGNRLYDLPRHLDKITPADIQAAAQKYFINFRMGVIYDEDKFNPKWAVDLIDLSTKR